jgi:glycerophosphoryl diester phosphodiesterase
MEPPRLTAHSGCLGTPPNSLPHLDAALASGVSFVEIDLRLGARGDLVLSHDPVADGGPDPLTLGSVWSRVVDTGVGFNLDVKERRVLEPLARFLSSRPGLVPSQVVITGCDGPWAAAWRLLLPGVPVLYNVLVGPRAGETASAWDDRTVGEALACGAAGLNCDHGLASPGLVAAARRAGLGFDVWTVNESDDLRRCFSLEIDGLTTDRPDRAHALFTQV